MALRFAQGFGVCSVRSAMAVALAAGFCLFADAAYAESLNWAYPRGNTPILNSTSVTTINRVTVSTIATAAGTFESYSYTFNNNHTVTQTEANND